MTNAELIIILQQLSIEAEAASTDPGTAPQQRVPFHVIGLVLASFALKVTALPASVDSQRRDAFAQAVITGLMAGVEAGTTRRVTVAGVEMSYANAAFLIADALVDASAGINREV